MAEDRAASAVEVQDIISDSTKLKDTKILGYSMMKAYRKWYYLNRNFWPICHAYKFL